MCTYTVTRLNHRHHHHHTPVTLTSKLTCSDSHNLKPPAPLYLGPI